MPDHESSEAQPKPETVAATDELFKRQPPVTPTPTFLDEEDEIPTLHDEPPGHAPVGPDYVRELQLEFEEQQEEGKI